MISDNMIRLFDNLGLDLSVIDIMDVNIYQVCDSLQFIALICDIEREFNIVVPEEVLAFNGTVMDFVKEIESLTSDAVSRSV